METQTDICARFGRLSAGTAHTLGVRLFLPPERRKSEMLEAVTEQSRGSFSGSWREYITADT